MDFTYIDNLTDLVPAREDILSAGVLGEDCETGGFDAHKEKLMLWQISTRPDHAYVFNTFELNDPNDFLFLKDILADPNKSKIFQNGKFDLQFITKFFGGEPLAVERLYDTMIASKLLARGDNSITHSLGEIAKYELGITLDKSLQKSDFGSNTHSYEQLLYAAKDAAILHNIRESHLKKLESAGLKTVTRLECDAVASIADAEFNGIYLDQDEWAERIVSQTAQHGELEEEVLRLMADGAIQFDLFGVPYLNLDSPAQVGPILRRLGVPIGTSTKENELAPWRSSFEVVDKLLEYREVATALKKYGMDYLKFVNPATGRIHADFHQLTAPSGRMSCSKPNMQQIPREKIYRVCFKAQDQERGHIITADYGQIELRIMAMQSGDPLLVTAFKEGKDLHDLTAIMVLGCDPDDIPVDRRTIAKNLNFGTAYGVGAPRFSEQAGIPVHEAQVALDSFWNVYTILGKYLDGQAYTAAEKGYAKTHSGRTMILPKFDRQDIKAYSAAKRLGRNFGVQGTGADILKRALYLLRNAGIKKNLDLRVVNIVHDEIVIETNDCEKTAAAVVEECMIEAGQAVLKDIPCLVGMKVSKTWQK